MVQEDLFSIVRLLEAYWQGHELDDLAMFSTCYQLAGLVLEALPPATAEQIQQVPASHEATIVMTLDKLVERDPAVRILAENLLGINTTQSRDTSRSDPHITIHGSHNQISVGPHFEPVTQSMNPPVHNLHQPQTGDKAVQDTPPPPLFKLGLFQHHDDVMDVRIFQTPTGAQGKAVSPLPYTADELIPVLKALAADMFNATQFTNEQIAFLKRRGLLRAEKIDRRIHQLIGRALYDALFAGEVGEVLRAVLDQSRSAGTLHLQLYFDEDNVDLARYPWELIHDGRRPLIKNRVVYLTRYISYREPPPQLQLAAPFDLLYIAPRPRLHDRHTLPIDHDLTVIRETLADLERAGQVRIRIVTPPTLRALVQELQSRPAQIVHFDGHGSFARVCPGCQTRYYSHHVYCETCNDDISDVAPEGLLAFENEERQEDWVNSEKLASVMSSRGVQLAVLLSCTSGAIRGETVFTGVGPALIQSGIPMVIATQADISSDAARTFSEGLYRAFAIGKPPDAAAIAGRDLLLTEQEWYIPVVYLRDRR